MPVYITTVQEPVVPSTAETFNPNIIIPVESRSSVSESLDICLDLLSCIFGKEEVRKAVKDVEY